MSSGILYYIFLLTLALFSCGSDPQKSSEETGSSSKGPVKAESDESTLSDKSTILFFGNSLTAGMGVEASKAYPALIQDKLDSLGYDYNVVNAGLSGETTASGKNRLSWVLKQNVDIFVLELGANDGLRGIPLEETRKNLQEIIDAVKAENPDVKIVLAGMQIPPNMGQDYTSEFKSIFPELAKKNDTALIPFLLKDVAGDPDLNQPDGIHPTAEGYKIVAENVWDVLEEVLGGSGEW